MAYCSKASSDIGLHQFLVLAECLKSYRTSPLRIQDDSRGKVNTLGGDCISHGEKSSYEHVSTSGWLPRYSCLNVQVHKHCEW
jgi:hypothetical protein